LLATVHVAQLRSLRAIAALEPVLDQADAVAGYLFARLAHDHVETVLLLLLDEQRRLLREVPLSRGGLDDAIVSVREIARHAINAKARAIILVHNHPSGDPTPSPTDRMLTRRIAGIARELDMPLLDHFIIARGGWTSFRALGLI
jgi:DNA repair protein RadC